MRIDETVICTRHTATLASAHVNFFEVRLASLVCRGRVTIFLKLICSAPIFCLIAALVTTAIHG